MEFILSIFPVRGRRVYTPDIPCTGLWSLYSQYSLYGVVEFTLLIFPVRGRGVYTADIPCTGLGSLYFRYSLVRGRRVYTPNIPLYGAVEFILLMFPVRCCGVYTQDISCVGVMEFTPQLTERLRWNSGAN